MNAFLLVVTGLALLLAAVTSLVAWRVTREERRRSNARVAALSKEIYGDDDHLDEAVKPSASTMRHGLIAIGAIAVVGVVALTLHLGDDAFRVAGATALKAPTPDPRGASHKPVDAPLELRALEHERDGGRLVVRGLLRNPANGVERDGLMAVVLAYDREGDLLASGRAAVLAAKLTPGETTPFVVYLAAADTIDRFRVSFRTGTRVESHVDRRSRGDAAKEVDP